MKSIRFAKLAAAGLVLTTTAIAGLAFAGPEYRVVGDDGIAASPKVRQAINEKAAVTPVPAAAMACAKCKDVITVLTGAPAKGGEILAGVTKVAARHGCGDCGTTLDVTGVGKAKQTVATHKCAAAVPNKANCCKMTTR